MPPTFPPITAAACLKKDIAFGIVEGIVPIKTSVQSTCLRALSKASITPNESFHLSNREICTTRGRSERNVVVPEGVVISSSDSSLFLAENGLMAGMMNR
jgi:hypothetical protein